MEKYFNINKSGCSVKCKIYTNDMKGIKRVVLYGHGFGGHKDNKAAGKFAEHVLKKYKNTAVVTFDAPCHGDDVKKSLSLGDCDKYIALVSEYIKERFSPDKLLAYATSFGGYLFLKYLKEHDGAFDKLVLRCPAVNMFDVLSKRIISPDELKALSGGKPVLVGFDRKIKISRDFLNELEACDISTEDFSSYAGMILILHGTKDEIVPFESSEEFAKTNGIPFIPIDGADHRFKDPSTMDIAIKAIVEFFEF